MAYRPVGNHNDHIRLPAEPENLEMDTRYDPGAQEYLTPSVQPSLSDSKQDDKRPLFRSTSTSKHPPRNQWPVQSQQVATYTPLRSFVLFFDAMLASVPIMFVALALTAARIDGKPVSDYGNRLQETLLLSPTLFPILFAALMGRFFRHLGVYLAERGTTLGRLEQLVGCQSVFLAIERQITLRSWSVVGLFSILVWLLSPVGGQSALRLLNQENQSVASKATARYLDPMAISDSVLEGASSLNSGRATYTSIYLAALLSSSKYQDTSMDLWGNVKLPLYRNIANLTSDEWKPVLGHDGNNATYGSLIGVPTVGMPAEGLSNFSIRARQFDITCSSNELKTGDAHGNDTLFANMTATWTLKSDVVTPGANSKPNYPLPMFSISLADDTKADDDYSVASCALDFLYLEARVNCNGTSCGVSSMRKLDLISDGYEKSQDVFTRANIIYNQFNVLPRVDNVGVASAQAKGSSNSEKWMADPTNFIGATYDNVKLYKLDPDVFAQRLTILWNTFFQSTFATTAIGGALPTNLTDTGLLLGQTGIITFNATQADILKKTDPVYKLNWKWFGALLVSSLVLLVAAYAGLILKYITLAPDIISYASSLTLLNPYVPTPTGGTTLHGLERTALLHDMPVRIGDVCANEAVGAIAFARADNGRVARLSRQRWYI
jgi:hypothetical protein